MQVSQDAQKVFVGALVPSEQRQQLHELAREQDRSVSAVIRRALDAELHRGQEPVGAEAAK